MAKSYRPVQRDQVFLLPPDMSDWLPPDHLVWFVLDIIDVLDITDLEQCRRVGGAGAPGYDPRMLLGLGPRPAATRQHANYSPGVKAAATVVWKPYGF